MSWTRWRSVPPRVSPAVGCGRSIWGSFDSSTRGDDGGVVRFDELGGGGDEVMNIAASLASDVKPVRERSRPSPRCDARSTCRRLRLRLATGRNY